MITGMAMEMVRIGESEVEDILCPDELSYCRSKHSPQSCYAARLAAKRAFMKAIGSESGLPYLDMEVCRDELGKPSLRLSGEAMEAAAKAGVARIHLSMTHSQEFAAALVVLESD